MAEEPKPEVAVEQEAAAADGEATAKAGKSFEERLAELKKPEAVPQPKEEEVNSQLSPLLWLMVSSCSSCNTTTSSQANTSFKLWPARSLGSVSRNVTVSPVLTRNAPSIESMREIVAQSVVGSDDGAAVGNGVNVLGLAVGHGAPRQILV